MKADSRHHTPAPSREVGYLIAAAIGFLFAIGIFVLTESIVLAIAASVPIGMTLGIALAGQTSQKWPSRPTRLFLAIGLLMGIVALGSVIVLLR